MLTKVGDIQISVIVPVFNEEKNIGPFLKRLEPSLDKVGTYEVIFCVDPCTDGTVAAIEREIKRNPRIRCLVFSRRFGQAAATMAGIHKCVGDTCVPIDVDLQDPPEIIPAMYAKYIEGFDVVVGKRRSRQGETLVKMLVNKVGYKLIDSISNVNIPRDAGDFRLMSRRVVEAVKALPETNGFLRGLVGYVGFRQVNVEFDRDPRLEGETNYNPYTGSLKIGFNGIFGFSNVLLTWVLMAGFGVAFVSFLSILAIIVTKIAGFPYPIGIPTVLSFILFMGGIQLICLGIVGEYIGRIYDDVKRRPMFIVDQFINPPKETVRHDGITVQSH